MSAQGDKAREAAVHILGESRARRMDPVTEVIAECEEVRVTVCPTERNVWETWCNMFRVDRDRIRWGRGQATVHGKWLGADVYLIGLDTARWAPEVDA